MQSRLNSNYYNNTAKILPDSVTYAKIQNVSAEDKILGRFTAGAGDIEEIACTSTGRALIDDADVAAQITTLGIGTIATQDNNNVNIAGGSITGITDLAVADGGTGSSTASGARSNLGFDAGTYTPTLTNVTNIAASAVSVANYLRVGNSIKCSGRVTIDITAGSIATELGISLPVASSLSLFTQCAGFSNSTDIASLNASIRADITNDRAALKYIATAGVANYEFMYEFMYRVI